MITSATPRPGIAPALECPHSKTEVRRKDDSLGRGVLYEQCLACGAAASSALPQTTTLRKHGILSFKSVPLWDHDLASRSRREAHEEYLQSERWESKRRRVLERAGHVCQACLTRKATQVHHLTYDHWTNEPLYDLVAVCDPCHRAIHPDKPHSHTQAAQRVLTGTAQDHVGAIELFKSPSAGGQQRSKPRLRCSFGGPQDCHPLLWRPGPIRLGNASVDASHPATGDGAWRPGNGRTVRTDSRPSGRLQPAHQPRRTQDDRLTREKVHAAVWESGCRAGRFAAGCPGKHRA